MTIAIIGIGNMGNGLAKRLAGKVDLIVASRDEAKSAASATALGNDVKSTGIGKAIAAADIVVLALPYASCLELASMSELKGKVVIDMSNPVTPDFSGLLLGHSTSAAEEIQRAAKGAKVVKAFNAIFAGLFDASATSTQNIPVFVAGNDEAAVEGVAKVVLLAGFTPEKTGGLDAARLLEPLGMLNIRFGYGLGRGTSIAPGWLTVKA